jgi:hypothetical protein
MMDLIIVTSKLLKRDPSRLQGWIADDLGKLTAIGQTGSHQSFRIFNNYNRRMQEWRHGEVWKAVQQALTGIIVE